ncbi:MAG TPA: PP2C family protein-serine/threonine phosphatase, partial [candidate division Zixibacteria bacterium]|nr:PP2C family protein-serine/threonine phosphatase [candidate division Zixibacteria bacterium]
IADVAGKGVPAALLMASFRASLLAEIRNNFTVREICAKVNRLIHESVEPGDYVTAVYGALDIAHHHYHYSNAGHNPPILMRASGEIELLQTGGPPIGIVADTEYEEATVSLGPGDVLFAYTDGVTEAENSDGEQFGEERLVEFLRDTQKMGAEDICCGLHSAVRQFIGAAPQSDDLTMLVVKRNPS